MTKLFIAGLGLIGGSIAKKLKADHEDEYLIYAYTKNKSDIDMALKEKTIYKGYCEIKENDFFDFDVVLLAVPPDVIPKIAKELIPHFPKNTLFTDVGSVKGEIKTEMDKLNINYIGGHPMAGTEKSGYSESFPHLFENAYYFLTDKNPLTDKIAKDLGAEIIYCDPKTHDETVAVISHIPHALSSALVNLAIKNETEEKMLAKTAAGGFRDTTRISASSEELWEKILFSNKECVIPLLSDLEALLEELKKSLIKDERESVKEFLRKARLYRTELEESRKPLRRQYFDIYISVADKVGVISEISRILTENGINIKNIGILQSRELIGGTLILSVYTHSDYEKSIELLKDKFEITE